MGIRQWLILIFVTASMWSLIPLGETLKEDRLSLLMMMLYSGNPPIDGKGCQASVQIAIDTVNNRSDILPDFYIDPVFQDEAFGAQIVKVLLNYTRSFENNNNRPNVYQSPVVIGSSSSNGCKAIGPFLHHINSVDMSISCAAPFLTDRRVYRNLYLMRATGGFLPFPMLHFSKEVGGWNRMAIITNAASVFDYGSATVLFQMAPIVGVTVSFFDILLDFGDVTMVALKENDARVIVVFTSSKALIFRFMCQAMKFGIIGSKYVFFMLGIVYSDPLDLPLMVGPDCPRSVIVEQTKYVYWFAPIMNTDNPYVKSELGYNALEFETIYDRATKSIRAFDYDQRILCHDTTMQGLLVLDRADKALRRKNMTLRSYRDFPHRVMEIVNKTAGDIDYIGLRKGRMRYNKRGEVDAEIHAVWYWSPEKRQQWLYMLYQFDNGTGYDYDNYWLKKLVQPTWLTPNGKPPYDGWRQESIVVEVSGFVRIVIFVIAGACGLSHLLMLVKTLHVRNNKNIAMGMVVAKLLGYVGCLTLDGAAVIFAWESSSRPYLIWLLRIVLLSIGFAFTNSVLACRVMLMALKIRSIARGHYVQRTSRTTKKTIIQSGSAATLHMRSVNSQANLSVHTNTNPVGSVPTTNNVSNKRDSDHSNTLVVGPPSRATSSVGGFVRVVVTLLPEDVTAAGKTCARCVVEFAGASAIIIAVWLGSESLNCSAKKELTVSIESEDKIIDTFVTTCVTTNFVAWVLALVAQNLIILIVGGYFAFKLRYFHGAVSCPEFGLIKLGLVNASTIFCAGLLLVIVIGNPIGQQVVISFASLIYSLTTSATWALPLLRG